MLFRLIPELCEGKERDKGKRIEGTSRGEKSPARKIVGPGQGSRAGRAQGEAWKPCPE